MKADHRTRTTRRSTPLLFAFLCVLAIGTQAAQKNTPQFSEIPGVSVPQQALVPVAQATPAPEAAPPAPATLPAPAPAPAPAGAPEVKQVSEDAMVYSFQADALDVRAALATFARANNLNIVPDNDVTGTVTVDVRNLPLRQMMRALLEASDCTWQEEGGLIRVRNTETKTFVVDYLRLSRKGLGMNSAMLGSGGSSGGMGGGMGGMGGMGGGGGGGGGGSSGSGNYAGNVTSAGNSSVNVTADNQIDFWQELVTELGFMLTPSGKTSLAINKTAGIIQVSDRPSALKRVENYLKGVDSSIHRQVEIEAKLYDVTLNDQFQFGIDWVHMAKAYGGALGFGASTLPAAIGSGQLQDSAVGGLNRDYTKPTTAGGNMFAMVFTNFNTKAAITALEQQGNVEVISKPRLRTLNNQTALIKVGEEVPFFSSSTSYLPGTSAGTSTTLQESIVTSITIGTILSITPQISSDDWVSLDISPVLTSLKRTVIQPGSGGGDSSSGSSSGGATTAPDLETKQASTLVRVHNGTTVVLGGLIQTEEAKNDRKVPLLGDIPFLGKWLFTGTYRANVKRELVIFVTPTIIPENEQSVPAELPSRLNPPKQQKLWWKD